MFTTNKGADWLDWLSMAKFNYNNTPHRSTGKSPFAINRMYVLKTLVVEQREGLAPVANEIAQVYHEVHEALRKAQARMKDVGHHNMPVYEKGQRVWLSTDHLKSDMPRKFWTKWIGPYAVKEVKPNALELVLPKSMKIHPVVNIEQIKPFLNPQEEQRRYKPGAVYIGEDGSEDFEVEEIIDSRMHKGKL